MPIDSVSSQFARLEALRAACDRALPAAARGALFDGVAGMRLCNAAYDLFECDALYDMAQELAAPFGVTAEGAPVLHLADRALPLERALADCCRRDPVAPGGFTP
ncbi:MAG: hypothetical protein JWL96_700 [Sphingomonas bacterium]|uniref:hypothetical protein n=1 Tax=Sphingomonas bacterium TaxID=1895847 RepID=UPI0026062B5F|nr:hypothetical protein [Sphingomonas bacterium]MDB5708630.1 hypothetical protein [Sphingomonas bacterium]